MLSLFCPINFNFRFTFYDPSHLLFGGWVVVGALVMRLGELASLVYKRRVIIKSKTPIRPLLSDFHILADFRMGGPKGSNVFFLEKFVFVHFFRNIE